MKKLNKYIILGLLALSTGCSDMLDVQPTTFISDEAIWEDANLINQFVANTYGSMLCGFNRCTAGYGQTWSMSWAGNLDAAPAPGNAQLLAALGAAVIVVESAVVPLVLQAAELIADAVLHGVVFIIFFGALGDVAAEHPVVAEAQQHHADVQ